MLSVVKSNANSIQSYLSLVDPRARILFAVAFSVLVAWLDSFPALGVAFAASILAWFFSGVPLTTTFKRLLPLNTVFFGLFFLLPLTTPGRQAAILGPWSLSQEGLWLAIAIALKGNAIVLMMIDLFASMEATTLGHALNHLYVPQKFTILLLFTVRYVEVLHQEYFRLRAAMRVRAFRPGMNRHTYRTFGYLAGMMLVRSLDRSERILAAMKCRGFAGRIYLLDHFAFAKKDLPFCAASIVLLLFTAWIELCPKI